jgi:aspartate aminotransferase
MKLSERTQRIQPSPTLAITAKAAELRAQGIDVIGLGAGEPDFDTPQHIKQAAIEAINEGFTKYTAVDGIPELKQAIIDKFKRDNGFEYVPKQILVSVGGKQSCFNLAEALLNDGDEVIIPAPYWVSYPAFALLCGAKPVVIEAHIEQQFKITPEQLEDVITDKTRLMFINSPSNPSGMAYTLEELQALGEVLRKHPNIIIATDDMYEHILFDGKKFVNILNACPDLKDRIVVLNGVSKAYSMTGWRIGYCAGPEDLIKAMKKVQSQSTSNPCSIAQRAAVAALNGPQDCVGEMVVAFKRRHDFVVEGLNAIPGISCASGDGTFYAFADIREAMKTKGFDDDAAFCAFLLSEAKVAVVPGSAFGIQGYMRLSFATSDEKLKTALERIKAVL